MKLSGETKRKLLAIKEAGLKKADLAKLENCLSAIRSQEDMVADGDYVSCRSKLSDTRAAVSPVFFGDYNNVTCTRNESTDDKQPGLLAEHFHDLCSF